MLIRELAFPFCVSWLCLGLEDSMLLLTVLRRTVDHVRKAAVDILINEQRFWEGILECICQVN